MVPFERKGKILEDERNGVDNYDGHGMSWLFDHFCTVSLPNDAAFQERKISKLPGRQLQGFLVLDKTEQV